MGHTVCNNNKSIYSTVVSKNCPFEIADLITPICKSNFAGNFKTYEFDLDIYPPKFMFWNLNYYRVKNTTRVCEEILRQMSKTFSVQKFRSLETFMKIKSNLNGV